MQIKVDLKIFLFFLIFLVTQRIKIYGILMLFALIHEIGHLICGLILGFKPENMSILPYGLKITFKTKTRDYNKKIIKGNILSIKKIVLALAGPFTNIICLVITCFYFINNDSIINVDIYQNIMYANILLAIFNLLPIYPLDGGRILKELIHIFCGLRKSYIYTQNISEITLYLISILSSVLILYYKNIAIFVIVMYLWIIVFKNKKEIRFKERIYESIEKYKKTD